jgi:hypothetical protein
MDKKTTIISLLTQFYTKKNNYLQIHPEKEHNISKIRKKIISFKIMTTDTNIDEKK